MAQFIIGMILAIVGFIVMSLGGYIAKDGWDKWHKKEDARNEPKVSVEDSHLQKSPIVVDSPGTIVGENITVTPKKPDRHLNAHLTSQIDQKLINYQKKDVKIMYLTGNAEAQRFSIEIANYLKSKGLDVKGPYPAMFFGSSTEPQSAFINKKGILTFQIRNYE